VITRRIWESLQYHWNEVNTRSIWESLEEDPTIPTFMAQAGEAVYTVPNRPGHPPAALRTFPTLQNPACYSLITKVGVPHVSDRPTAAKGKRKAAGSPEGSGVKPKRIRSNVAPPPDKVCAGLA
jgi:hypothetical protein